MTSSLQPERCPKCKRLPNFADVPDGFQLGCCGAHVFHEERPTTIELWNDLALAGVAKPAPAPRGFGFADPDAYLSSHVPKMEKP